MSSYYFPDSFLNPVVISDFESRGLVTRTFRRLERQRQLNVVNAIFEEATHKDPTALNIKEVARRADVSIGSLYQYFGSRQGLLDFTIELVVFNTLTLFEGIYPYIETMSLREILPLYVLGIEEWTIEQRGAFLFFVRAAYQGDPGLQERVVRPVAESMFKITHKIVDTAIQRGEVRADIDQEATTRLINTLLIALGDSYYLPHLNTYYQAADEKINHEQLLQTLIDLLAPLPTIH
jgi:TetR/AcrR family transcriptional regulator